MLGMSLAWIILATFVGGIAFGSFRRAFGGLFRLIGLVLLGVCLMACLIVMFSSLRCICKSIGGQGGSEAACPDTVSIFIGWGMALRKSLRIPAFKGWSPTTLIALLTRLLGKSIVTTLRTSIKRECWRHFDCLSDILASMVGRCSASRCWQCMQRANVGVRCFVRTLPRDNARMSRCFLSRRCRC